MYAFRSALQTTENLGVLLVLTISNAYTLENGFSVEKLASLLVICIDLAVTAGTFITALSLHVHDFLCALICHCVCVFLCVVRITTCLCVCLWLWLCGVSASAPTVQMNASKHDHLCRLAPSVGWQKTQWQPAYASQQRSSAPGGLNSSCTLTSVAALATTIGSSLAHSCCTWQPSLLAWGRSLGLSMLKSTLYR